MEGERIWSRIFFSTCLHHHGVTMKILYIGSVPKDLCTKYKNKDEGIRSCTDGRNIMYVEASLESVFRD
jgi:hypothetical protein